MVSTNDTLSNYEFPLTYTWRHNVRKKEHIQFDDPATLLKKLRLIGIEVKSDKQLIGDQMWLYLKQRK